MMKYLIAALLFVPAQAFSSEKMFNHESEVSMVVNGGNSQSETYFAKTTNTYKVNKESIGFGGHYSLGSSNDVVTVRNWDGNIRYDHDLSPKMSIFLGEKIQGDRFSGYDSRYNTDVGARYHFIQKEKTKLFGDLGYRYSIEKKVDLTETKDSKGRIYLENSNKHSADLSSKFLVEYLPNFTESEDWILNFEASLQVQLNKTLSFKFGYNGIYDNLPAGTGNKKYDYNYVTSLIAKF